MEAYPAHKVARQPIPKRLTRPEAVAVRNSVTHLKFVMLNQRIFMDKKLTAVAFVFT